MHKTDNFKSLVLHKTDDFKSPFLHKTDNFCHSQKGIRLPPRLLPLIASTAVTPGEAFGEEDGDSCDCRTPAMWASCARSRNKYDKARPGKEDLDGRKEGREESVRTYLAASSLLAVSLESLLFGITQNLSSG